MIIIVFCLLTIFGGVPNFVGAVATKPACGESGDLPKTDGAFPPACYRKVESSNIQLDDAEAWCASTWETGIDYGNGHLVSIMSSDEEDYVLSYVHTGGDHWIGIDVRPAGNVQSNPIGAWTDGNNYVDYGVDFGAGETKVFFRLREDGKWRGVDEGRYSNEDGVCSGHGFCTADSVCSCSTGYLPPTCIDFTCGGIVDTNTTYVCNGKGTCTSPNQCTCKNGYSPSGSCSDTDCNGVCDVADWKCNGIAYDDPASCTNLEQGVCNTGTFECDCAGNWTGDSCNIFKNCFGHDGWEPDCCGGHGTCVGVDQCDCDDFWGKPGVNLNCTEYRCGIYLHETESDLVCNGNGNCFQPDACQCNSDWFGNHCEENIPSLICEVVNETITIDYIVDTAYISYSYNFPCALLFENFQDLGYLSECEWIVGEDLFTSSLLLTLGESSIFLISDVDRDLVLKKILTGSSSVTFTVNAFTGNSDDGDDPSDDDGGLDPILFAVITSAAGTVGVALFLLVLCIFICVLCVLRKRISKFQEIDDIDVLLQEKKMEKLVGSAKTKIKVSSRTKKLFEVDPKEISLVHLIGEGGSNTSVFLVKWKGKYCAYKSFRVDKLGEKIEEFEREVVLYIKCRHPSILTFFGACLQARKIGIILEYCALGDMFKYLSTSSMDSTPVSIKEKIRLLKEIAQGMQFLHSEKVVHRDLKPENVLIADSYNAKIMDFGLSKLTADADKTQTRAIGTSFYASPEILSGKYSSKVDVFSFSILCLVVITEEFYPYGTSEGGNSSSLMWRVAKDPTFRPHIHEKKFEMCSFMIEFIKRNWNHDPKKRDNFNHILEFLDRNYKEMKELEVKKAETGSVTSRFTKVYDEVAEDVKDDLQMKQYLKQLRRLSIRMQLRIRECKKKAGKKLSKPKRPASIPPKGSPKSGAKRQ